MEKFYNLSIEMNGKFTLLPVMILMLTNFMTAKAQTYPVSVISPADGATNVKPAKTDLFYPSITLQVSTYPGALGYIVEYVSDDNYNSTTFNTSGAPQGGSGPTTTFPAGNLRFGTKYHVRVSTNNIPLNKWGPETTFTTAGMSFISPSNGSTINDTTVNVTLTQFTGAKTYTIKMSTDNTFPPTGTVTKSGSNTEMFSHLLYGTTYYLIATVDNAYFYTKPFQFTVGPPEQFTYAALPSDDTKGTNVNLTVTSKAVKGAKTYTIDLSPAIDFSSGVITGSGAMSQSFSHLSYGTKYYVRVKTDLSSVYGKVTSFTTRTAESITYVMSPMDGATGLGVSLSVSSTMVIGAATYTIELNTASDFSGTSFVKSGSGNTHSFSGLSYGTKYYTRVITDLTTNYGKITNFTTSSVEKLTYITSPTGGTMNVSYLTNVTANMIPGATSYTIELNPDVNFAAITAITKTSAANTKAFSLAYATKYYARVMTDLSDAWGTNIKSFTTGDPVSLAYITSPKNGGTGVPNTVTVHSNAVAGATNYIIEVSPTSDFSTGTKTHTSSSPSTSFGGLANSTTYYAHVQTDLVPGSWGATSTFTTTCPSCRASSDWVGKEGSELITFEPAQLSAYPVPIKDRLNILVQAENQSKMQVVLFDMTGKEVHSHAGITNRPEEINFDEFGSGIYIIKVMSSGGVMVRKVMKE